MLPDPECGSIRVCLALFAAYGDNILCATRFGPHRSTVQPREAEEDARVSFLALERMGPLMIRVITDDERSLSGGPIMRGGVLSR